MHTTVCVMVVCMPVDRISLALDPEVGKAVRRAAEREGKTISAWMSEVVQARLRNDLLGDYLDDWEAEHGAFTDEELAVAAKELGLPTDRQERLALRRGTP
jgi:hypothetical protein